MFKTCSMCRVSKSVKDFYKTKTSYRSDCKQCTKEINRLRRIDPNYIVKHTRKCQYPHEHIYNLIKSRCKNKEIKLYLTPSEVGNIIYLPCYYCGHLDKREWRQGRYALVNNIDRVDPKGPYSISNSVSCCKKCNIMKHTMTKQEFLEQATAIVKNKRLS